MTVVQAILNDTFYTSLLSKFLYNNDYNCIYNILDVYLNRGALQNFKPSYKTIKNIKSRLNYFFRKHRNKNSIVATMIQSIHEEVNRLELYFYIVGYDKGYSNGALANALEKILVESKYKNTSSIVSTYDKLSNIKLDKLRKHSKLLSHNEDLNRRTIKKLIYNFSDDMIKEKVFKINKKIDKQMIITFDEESYMISEDGCLITKNSLTEVYNRICKTIYKNCISIHDDAYWYGVYDRVMQRYK